MSDFFADIYRGIQNPAVVMNNGPLPPESMKGQSYPPGFDGTPGMHSIPFFFALHPVFFCTSYLSPLPRDSLLASHAKAFRADGRINQASTLLGDSSVQPYALGHADRLSTQTAYLNIPHAAYRVVPPINLPDTIGKMDEGAGTFQLTHQVDDGDVAFVIRAMYTPHNIVENKGRYARQGILHAVDPVCNLATVNYILHGIQRYGFDPKNVHWNTLWVALGLETQFEGYKAKNNGRSLSALMKEATEAIENNGYLTLSYYAIIRECRKIIAEHLIKNVIRPFGVAKGSEKQGGQHQGLVNRSVTWPVDYVTTLVIDGKTINLVNYWRQDEISGGDDLLFYLQEHNATEYVLSHHPKSYRKVKYPSLKKYPIPDVLVDKKSDNTSQREIAQRFFDTMGEVLLLFDLIFNDGIGRVVGDDDRVDPEDDRADDESFLVARVAGRVDKKGQGVVGEPFHAYSITVTDEDAKMFELEFAQRFILEVNNVLTEKNMTPWINFMEQLKNRLSSGMGEDISDIGEGVLDTCFYVYDTLAKMLPTKDESKVRIICLYVPFPLS